ncbi:MAG: signal peptidase I [Myxococcales bacterium]|nr:signal peptidase I [Myxococcales bacterium]
MITVAPAITRPANRMARLVFYAVWVFAVPLAASLVTIWIFTPADGARTVGALESQISEQKIPFGIVFFTLFAVLIWRFRHDLPLAAAAGIGGRRDLPAKLRARFEEAGALLEEARRIMRSRRRDVERELVPSEREDVEAGLEELERVMTAEPFVATAFEKAHARAERLVGEHLSRWRKGEIREYAESIAIAVGVALLLRAFVVEAFKIPSGSMIPTLLVGDHIFVNKFVYGPQIPFTERRVFESLPPERGDVIVFKFPENPEQDFIKRVVAVPGDVLEVVDGRPIINGWIVPQCHVGSFKEDGKTSELYVEYLHDKAFFTLFDQKPGGATCETAADCSGAERCFAGYCGRDEYHRGPWTVPERQVWVMGDNRFNSHDSRQWAGGRGAGVPFENIRGRAMIIFATFNQTGGVLERMALPVMGKPHLPSAHAHLQPQLEKCLREPPQRTTPPGR